MGRLSGGVGHVPPGPEQPDTAPAPRRRSQTTSSSSASRRRDHVVAELPVGGLGDDLAVRKLVLCLVRTARDDLLRVGIAESRAGPRAGPPSRCCRPPAWPCASLRGLRMESRRGLRGGEGRRPQGAEGGGSSKGRESSSLLLHREPVGPKRLGRQPCGDQGPCRRGRRRAFPQPFAPVPSGLVPSGDTASPSPPGHERPTARQASAVAASGSGACRAPRRGRPRGCRPPGDP